MIHIDLETRQAIEYVIKGLQTFEQNKAIREGLNSAVKIFKDLGRANLASRIMGHGEQTGDTLRSFATRASGSRRRSLTSAAGLRRPLGYRGHWHDRGTVARYTKAGAYRGIMPSSGFMEDARIEGERPALDAIFDGIQEAIARINSRR